MKILFEDVLQETGVVATSLHETVNYPPSKLFDRFLWERFQSDEADDTLTVELPEEKSMNCLFLGYTNSQSYVIKLYDTSDVLLLTIEVDSPGEITALHFTEIDVKYITIELSAPSGSIAVYLGGVAGGISELFPNPVAAWNQDVTDNSNFSNSSHGQSLQNYINPLRKIAYDFQDIERTRALEIQELYKNKGIGGIIWLDAFESSETFEAPLRAIIIDKVMPIKLARRYGFTLSVLEAR
jgi:hypothetical protein